MPEANVCFPFSPRSASSHKVIEERLLTLLAFQPKDAVTNDDALLVAISLCCRTNCREALIAGQAILC
jgi:hypothetical protein